MHAISNSAAWAPDDVAASSPADRLVTNSWSNDADANVNTPASCSRSNTSHAPSTTSTTSADWPASAHCDCQLPQMLANELRNDSRALSTRPLS